MKTKAKKPVKKAVNPMSTSASKRQAVQSKASTNWTVLQYGDMDTSTNGRLDRIERKLDRVIVFFKL